MKDWIVPNMRNTPKVLTFDLKIMTKLYQQPIKFNNLEKMPNILQCC